MSDAESMQKDLEDWLHTAGWLTSDRCEVWAARIVAEEGVPTVRRCRGCDSPAVEIIDGEPLCAYHAENRRAFAREFGT